MSRDNTDDRSARTVASSSPDGAGGPQGGPRGEGKGKSGSRVTRRGLLLGAGGLVLAGAAGTVAARHLAATSPVSVENSMPEPSGRRRSVLVVTGSARQGGNSDVMASAFMRGAVEAGHGVLLFEAGRTPVGGCLHCESCWSGGRPCVQEDAFDTFWPMLEASDLLVFCSPLYWYNFSGQIKCLIDRLYPYSRGNCPRKLRVKESMLLMCGETPLPRSFAGAYESWRQSLGILGWKDRGRLFATMVGEYGDMAKDGALETAREMGRRV